MFDISQEIQKCSSPWRISKGRANPAEKMGHLRGAVLLPWLKISRLVTRTRTHRDADACTDKALCTHQLSGVCMLDRTVMTPPP
ncbi:hypothetical protein QQF64_022703 [Cirrhinus molitorella]|uniref:Uncharacterized protein n=1 Tax=Cirrhinus molitorella TaxID=172907 RepID=A0ABR3L3D9_9TELE